MLADQLDYVIGVDPHRDAHALAVVEARTGVVVFEAVVSADGAGYTEALEFAELHAEGRRAFAVEGTGSFGAGLTRLFTANREQVFEVSRLRRERRSGGKTRRARRDPRRPQRSERGQAARDPACQRGTRSASGPACCSRSRDQCENRGRTASSATC
jgi:hypothetical protein